jgi:hypothetical protein
MQAGGVEESKFCLFSKTIFKEGCLISRLHIGQCYNNKRMKK